MSINATNSGVIRELIPAGNYIARCYQMVEIGTVPETFQGETKTLKKVRIGWELPTETRVFNEEKGEQPMVISQEYTLSMNEKANLRKMLASWRGKDFTEDEAKSFDITKLLGVPCMVNVIHKPGKSDPTKLYQSISSVSAMPKGMKAPDQVNPFLLLSYDQWEQQIFDKLPDFIKAKMQTSIEFASLTQPHVHNLASEPETIDDLPF
jgi:hypothetical protein